jgi:hypothetical protein
VTAAETEGRMTADPPTATSSVANDRLTSILAVPDAGAWVGDLRLRLMASREKGRRRRNGVECLLSASQLASDQAALRTLADHG